MKGLRDLITSVDHNMKTVVAADSFTTDLWNISDDIKSGVMQGILHGLIIVLPTQLKKM